MIKFTLANTRTIAAYGESACRKAYFQNVQIGEGPCMIGGNDARIGNNLINAGRKLVQVAQAKGINTFDEAYAPVARA